MLRTACGRWWVLMLRGLCAIALGVSAIVWPGITLLSLVYLFGTFTLIEVECLGACDRAPVVMVNDDWHEGLTPEQCAQFIDDVRARGTSAFTGCHLKKERA